MTAIIKKMFMNIGTERLIRDFFSSVTMIARCDFSTSM